MRGADIFGVFFFFLRNATFSKWGIAPLFFFKNRYVEGIFYLLSLLLLFFVGNAHAFMLFFEKDRALA